MSSGNNEGLKKSALGGMFWVFAERMSGKLVSLVVTVVLARLLMPEDYSIINIVVNVSNSIRNSYNPTL